MKRTFLLTVAVGVLLSASLAADDRRNEATKEKENDRQARQEQLEKRRETMRQHARKLRAKEREQAQKARGLRQKVEEQPNGSDTPGDAHRSAVNKVLEQPRRFDSQQPSSGYAIDNNVANLPGPVYPPVPVQSLFNAPTWYGVNPRGGPYPNAGFALRNGYQGGPTGAMPPPAPPFFGYLVMPPGSPVTVPYIAPEASADAGAETTVGSATP